MAKKRLLIDRMDANPADDWSIADVEKLCKQNGLDIQKPNGGSHHVVSSPYLEDHVCVPYKRPIKKLYIKTLVSYTRAHIECKEREQND